MNKKAITKIDWIASIVVILIIIFALFYVGSGNSLSIAGTSDNFGEIDTTFTCQSLSQCRENPDLEEIKDIVYCDTTCKFEGELIGGEIYE